MKYQSFHRTSENFFLTYLLPSTPPNPHTLSLLDFMKIGKPLQTPKYCGSGHIQNFTDIFTNSGKNHDYPLKCFNASLNVNFHLLLLLNLYKMILLSLIYIRTSSFSERNNEFYNRMISSSSGNNPVHFRAHLALLFTNFSCSEQQGWL